jgi:hypothetical protein
MKLQPGTPVETNDVHALSISFSSGEFLRVLREQKARARKQKKKKHTVDSRRRRLDFPATTPRFCTIR